jgi:hypothetical protein
MAWTESAVPATPAYPQISEKLRLPSKGVIFGVIQASAVLDREDPIKGRIAPV